MSSFGKDIGSLFFVCNELRVGLGKVTVEAEKVKETAMNASVISSQTGKHTRACAEMANQTSLTAKRMMTTVESARIEVNTIANLSLTAVVLEMSYSRYLVARPTLKGQTNIAIVTKVMNEHLQKISSLVSQIDRHVYQAQALTHQLTQQQMRLFAITKSLRIESADLFGQQLAVVGGLAVDLASASDDGLLQIDSLKRTLKNIKRVANSIKSCV